MTEIASELWKEIMWYHREWGVVVYPSLFYLTAITIFLAGITAAIY